MVTWNTLTKQANTKFTRIRIELISKNRVFGDPSRDAVAEEL